MESDGAPPVPEAGVADSRKLYLGNLNSRVEKADVYTLIGHKYGRIENVEFKTGFAFVMFDDDRMLDQAVEELHGKDLKGQPVKVERARGRNTAYPIAPGSSRCFRCHKEGHWVRECPLNQEGADFAADGREETRGYVDRRQSYEARYHHDDRDREREPREREREREVAPPRASGDYGRYDTRASDYPPSSRGYPSESRGGYEEKYRHEVPRPTAVEREREARTSYPESRGYESSRGYEGARGYESSRSGGAGYDSRYERPVESRTSGGYESRSAEYRSSHSHDANKTYPPAKYESRPQYSNGASSRPYEREYEQRPPAEYTRARSPGYANAQYTQRAASPRRTGYVESGRTSGGYSESSRAYESRGGYETSRGAAYAESGRGGGYVESRGGYESRGYEGGRGGYAPAESARGYDSGRYERSPPPPRYDTRAASPRRR